MGCGFKKLANVELILRLDRTLSGRFLTELPRDRELIFLPDGEHRSPPVYSLNLVYDRPDKRTERIGVC